MEESKPSPFPPSASLSTLGEWLDLPTTTTTTTTINSSSSSSSSNLLLLQSLDPQQYVHDFWKNRTRPDGRLFSQSRPCKVVTGMLRPHSAGSALVTTTTTSTINTTSTTTTTKVLAATTLHIGQPSPDRPDRGDIVVHVTGSGGHNIGTDFLGNKQQQQNWDVLQAWLQRTLEEEEEQQVEEDGNGGCAIPSRLKLWTGKAALRLVVTVHILEDGGNIEDAALLACMAAWKDTTPLPQLGKDLVPVPERGGALFWKNHEAYLEKRATATITTEDCNNNNNDNNDRPPRAFRVSLTMGVWRDPQDQTTHLLVDPSLHEKQFVDGTLTMVVDTSSGRLQPQYTGKVPLTANDLALAAKLSQARADELAAILLS
ncbi:3' exoribonuclease family, domain containing protein [Nitzschia inconspicua]|uniref:3' exoribonuclease family, domain containing protein n=1 Tax=Nitzschia inconspicua TaxID=303405 RepID=A0A9K3KJD2_9STRA|nr:3' exoribonuclease family, domain containing protein [Nitzschia inconspicua]